MARDTSDTSDTSAQMDLSGYSRVAQDCRQPASPRLRAMVSGRVANVGEWCDHHADRLSRERAALVASIARAERLSSGGSAAAREMADRLVADRSARIAEIDGLLAEIAAYRAGTDTDPDRLGERPIRTPSQTRATVAVQGIGIEGYRAVFVADGVETHHHDFERRHGHTLAQAKKQAIGMLRAIIARHRGRGDHRVHLHALRLVDTTTPEQYRVGFGPQFALTPDPAPVFSL